MNDRFVVQPLLARHFCQASTLVKLLRADCPSALAANHFQPIIAMLRNLTFLKFSPEAILEGARVAALQCAQGFFLDFVV